MLTFISGGTGTPKLLQGMMKILPQEEISVIVNTGEDTEISGTYISPDLDTVVYTLAGIVDDEKWYGIEGDTFLGHDTLSKLGHEELLRIGDEDRAVKLYRTFRMREGAALSEVTEEICEGFGVEANVLPMTDDRVKTQIITEDQVLRFHEFWVAKNGEPKVEDVNFLGAAEADPAPGVLRAIESSDSVIIGPSNPVTSVGPILAIDEIRSVLESNQVKVIVISPVLRDSPVSGPTGALMRGLGREVSPIAVAEMYEKISDLFILHEEDESMTGEIEGLGMEVFLTDLLLPDPSSRKRLAREILKFLDER